jgi:hypothetical protein
VTVLQLEHASVGRPITRNGVSLVPVYVHQSIEPIATGASAAVQISDRVAHERVLHLVDPALVLAGHRTPRFVRRAAASVVADESQPQ